MKTLPVDLSSKMQQNLQTKSNNADPNMQVVVARAKSSVQDASYFTVENIRTKTGLTDVSVTTRRMKSYGPPNGIFAIHIDNGVAKTLKREYPDKLKLGWQDAFTVGAAKSVAITFDGYWDRYRKLWQLVNVEYPEIFWVDMNNKLQTQTWNSDNPDELSENVLKVKAIRGWRNTAIRMQDTGIIAAYIKTDGRLYYRNFTEQENGLRAWEPERLIEEFTGVAVNINLFLTNDYRTAIIVEDNLGQTHWIITGRNWAGMAISPEKFSVSANATVKLIPVRYHKSVDEHIFTVGAEAVVQNLYADKFNRFKIVQNIDDGLEDFGNTVKFTSLQRLVNFNSGDFSIKDERNITFGCTEIIESNPNVYGWEYTAIFANFNNAYGNGTLKFLSTTATNEAGYFFDPFQYTFEFVNLIPLDIPAPLVTSITSISDTGILIEFDSLITSGVNNSLSAFSIVNNYWKDTFGDIPIAKPYIMTSIEHLDDTHILLTVKHPQDRIRRSHTIDVIYDTSLGSISGVSYPLDSFNISFVPNIVPLLDPATRENFKVTTDAFVSHRQVSYNNVYGGAENFKLTADANITLTFVGIINP